MSMQWPLTSFNNFIKLRKRFITIQDDYSYERVTARLHTKGIIKRDVILGSQIKTKKQQVIQAHDLLVAEIDAKLGGFGIVPPELDGAIVSNHYFSYEVDTAIIDLDYLEYYLRSGRPREDIQQYVKGSTNYSAIRDYHFPKLRIPLPSLEDQRRIVTILDAFTTRLNEALHLFNVMVDEAKEVFSFSIDTFLNDLPTDQRRVLALAQIATYIQRGISPNYDNVGEVLVINQKCVRPEGLVLEQARKLANDQVSKLAQERFLKVGDVLLNSTGEGTLGRSTIAKSMEVKAVVDSHVTIIRPNQDIALPEWIDYFLKSSKGQQQIQVKKTGSTKQTELGRSSILGLQLTVPDVEVQRKIIIDIDSGTRISSSLIAQLKGMIERCESSLSQLLTQAFFGKLRVNVPKEILEELRVRKNLIRKYQQEVLIARHREAEIKKEEQRLMGKIEVKEAFDLTQLVHQYLNKDGRIDAIEFWQLIKTSGLEIDTFYAYLKTERLAGRIKDIREDHRVYLELSNPRIAQRDDERSKQRKEDRLEGRAKRMSQKIQEEREKRENRR